MRYRLLIASALFAVIGCGRAPAKNDQVLTLDQVPEPAMKAALEAAKKNFPDLKFHSVSLRSNGVYEISGKTKNGKIHDVEVKADGEIVEIE